MRPSLSRLAPTPFSFFRYRYYPTYIASDNPRHALADNSHILHLPFAQRQAARPRRGLWWSVTANTMPGKSVVRHWAQRRLRAAIVRALDEKGWDRSGRRKSSEGMGAGGREDRVTERKGRDLEGTLQVHTYAKILQATGFEVQREAGALIKIVRKKAEEWRKQEALSYRKKI